MHNDDLLLAAVILLAAAVVAVPVSTWLGLGSVLGYLMAGIVVGPWGLGVTQHVEAIRHFSELGVVFLLFIIGLELRPSKLWAMRREVFGLGLLQIIISAACITVYAWWFGLRLNVALVIGFGLALSSTAVGLQILTEKGELSSRYGQAAFSILLMQDIAVIPLLALVPLLGWASVSEESALLVQSVLGMGVLGGILLAARFLLRPALRFLAQSHNTEIFAAVSVLAVLGAAWLAAQVNLSMALGAFLVGLLLSDSEYRHQLEAEVEPFRGFLLGLFFMAIGMSIDFSLMFRGDMMILGHLVAMLVIKSVILFGLCLAFGLSRHDAVRVALLLPQCGEFGFVLFGVAAVSGLMGQAVFQPLLLLIAITMMATPVLVMIADRFVRRATHPDPEDAAGATRQASGLKQHVIIAGFGRVGETVALILQNSGVPYIALERDPHRSAVAKAQGYNVFLGDATRTNVLKAVSTGQARLAVVTLDTMTAVEKTVSAIRYLYPALPIEARTRDLAHSAVLQRLGATGTIPETLEASLQLGRTALLRSGIDEESADDAIESLRRDDYLSLRRLGNEESTT